MFEHLVIGAYAGVNSLRVFSYVPQIVKIARLAGPADAISLVTWALWTISHLTTALYGAVILRDLLIVTVFAGNAACCGLVIVMVLWKRRAPVGPVGR